MSFDEAQYARDTAGKFTDCGDAAQRISTAREPSVKGNRP